MKRVINLYDDTPAYLAQIIAVRDIKGTNIKKGDIVLYLGEIPNMREHIAFIDQEGKVWWGYHDDNFRYAKQDEIRVRI